MNNFEKDLARSHAEEDNPVWEKVYRQAFPGMQIMTNHRDNGPWQQQGIDRSITLANSKQILIDEKVRFRNKKTGEVYRDIALEYLADKQRKTPGWVCKPLLCDYIAYMIAPLGECYLLPVVQLQHAWEKNKTSWLGRYPIISAQNERNGKVAWVTLSCCVPENVVFRAIGKCLRVYFEAFEDIEERAAIREYDGGFSRDEANSLGVRDFIDNAAQRAAKNKAGQQDLPGLEDAGRLRYG